MPITRRTMLGAVGAAVCGPILARPNAADSREQLAGLACNMESWWTDRPFMDRFVLAADSGFSAVEFWDYAAAGRDMDAVGRLCRARGLDVVQFTAWGGPSLADPDNHREFEASIEQAVELASQLDAPMFTVVGHQTLAGVSQLASVDNLTRALERVVPILEDAEKMIIVEPFNPVDHQGHFLNGSADVLAICRGIDSPFVKINWDLYHMQLTEGNLVANMQSGYDQIGYVQVADVPGRHQPGTGELNYRYIFEALDELGYVGPVGLECWPRDDDEQVAIASIAALRHRG